MRGAGVAVREGLRVDWFRVLVDLRRLGWTSARVAGEIDMPRTTVDGWKAGAVPRYDPGERLVALWVEVTGNARGDVPRVRPDRKRVVLGKGVAVSVGLGGRDTKTKK